MIRQLGILLCLAAYSTTAVAELDRILIYPKKILGISSGPVCHWSAVESKGVGEERLVQFEVATEGYAEPKVQWRLPVYATTNGGSRTEVRRIGEAKLDNDHRFSFHVSVSDLGKASDVDAFHLEVSDAQGHQSKCALKREVIASLLDAAPAANASLRR